MKAMTSRAIRYCTVFGGLLTAVGLFAQAQPQTQPQGQAQGQAAQGQRAAGAAASAQGQGRRGRGAPVPLDERGVPVGVTVRPGYQLSLALELPGARFMRFGPDGTLYVSRVSQGDIQACKDKDGDGKYETVTTFVTGHPQMQGMCWYDGWLYFSEPGAIFRARDTKGTGVADEIQTIIPRGELPTRGSHFWRSILVYKDRLYTEIGDTDNINDLTTVTAKGVKNPIDADREKVWSYSLDGKDKKLFATGLRNTEKMVIRPGTDEIWGMDHGSDYFGGKFGETAANQPITDTNPGEKMNHIMEGHFYGHPFFVGTRVPRYEYMDRPDILALASKMTIPEMLFPAHNAPNSMEFYTGDQFPGTKGDAFVAFHGSWNRTVPDGYNVRRVLFDDGHPYGSLIYVSFLVTANGRPRPVARPVDTIMDKDGSLLISEDTPGRVFRLKYVGGEKKTDGK